jgi:hypothetical protein
MTTPSPSRATAWAGTVVSAVRQRYPWAAQHTVTGPGDVDVTPTRLHPAFHGSFDWHSCVHMHWSGLTLLDLPGAPVESQAAEALTALLDERLTAAHIAVEAELLRRRPSFERPYGWAWGLQLAAAAHTSPRARARGWAEALTPMREVLVARFRAWLSGMPLPVRAGVHSNTAFALTLARDAACALGEDELLSLIDETRARLVRRRPGLPDRLGAGWP